MNDISAHASQLPHLVATQSTLHASDSASMQVEPPFLADTVSCRTRVRWPAVQDPHRDHSPASQSTAHAFCSIPSTHGTLAVGEVAITVFERLDKPLLFSHLLHADHELNVHAGVGAGVGGSTHCPFSVVAEHATPPNTGSVAISRVRV